MSAAPDIAAAPWREVRLMPVDLEVARRDDGTILLASRIALKPYDANIPAAFARRAVLSGDQPALAARSAGRSRSPACQRAWTKRFENAGCAWSARAGASVTSATTASSSCSGCRPAWVSVSWRSSQSSSALTQTVVRAIRSGHSASNTLRSARWRQL